MNNNFQNFLAPNKSNKMSLLYKQPGGPFFLKKSLNISDLNIYPQALPGHTNINVKRRD
jgi:hypothetical protein